jgi:hypothetical protein
MIRRVRRPTLLGLCAIVVAAAFAASAQAAGPPTVTTLAATSITSNSAVLNGTISANGQATAWQFEWGTSANTLKLAPVPAGSVGPAGASVPVSAKLTGLKPNTTYGYTLLGASATNFKYYYLYGLATRGKTLSFTTPKAPGKLILTKRTLTVHRGKVGISLRCASAQNCKGKLTLTARGRLTLHGKKKTLACAKRKAFSVSAGKKKTTKVTVSDKCLTALGLARHHKITGKLTATTSTGQPKLKKSVTIKT